MNQSQTGIKELDGWVCNTMQGTWHARYPSKFFVSYSHRDEEFIEPVVQLLRRYGCAAIPRPGQIRPGKKWRLELQKHLQQAE